MKQKHLTSLLTRPDIWQASSLDTQKQGLDTGFRPLNQALHQGGWPQGGLTEILPDRMGGAELMLLMPCLARLSQQPGWLVLVAPPYIPYAPAWAQQGIDLSRIIVVHPRNIADLLWCTEQALSCHGNSLISWIKAPNIAYRDLRKLQVACQGSTGLSVLIRPARCAEQNSPAHLRLTLSSHVSHLELAMLKQQGGWAGQQVNLPLSQQLIQEQVSVEQLPVHRVSSLGSANYFGGETKLTPTSFPYPFPAKSPRQPQAIN